MDKKKYTEYTKEEKITLLKHWSTYFCKTAITDKELNVINKLIEERTDDVMDVAILCYIAKQGSTAMFNSLREEKLDKLLKVASMEIARFKSEYAKDLLDTQNKFIEMLTTSYNNLQSESLLEEQLLQEVLKIITADRKSSSSDQPLVLAEHSVSPMEQQVIEIFYDCSFKENELNNEVPKEPYLMVEGPIENYLFNAAKINRHKEEIANLIAELPGIDYGAKYLNLCMTKDKELWTKSQDNIERLVLLGLASEILVYTLPREYWTVDEGLPRLTRNKEKIHTKVKGTSPEEYNTKRGK